MFFSFALVHLDSIQISSLLLMPGTMEWSFKWNLNAF
jgi:hypothetical protein